MDETYPILLSGERAGSLTVSAEGLFTRFVARCSDPGGVVRLSVYGGGREGYLGVMEPEGGQLYLERRLSRAAMVSFPETIEFASEAGRKKTNGHPQPAAPSEERESRAVCPESAEENTDLLWYRAGDGSLVTAFGGRQYRAIPMAAWGLPMEQAVDRRTIDGVEYAVFALDPPLAETEE